MFDTRHGTSPVNPEIITDSVNLETLSPWFDLIHSLQPAYHQRFILAAKFYQQALQQSQDDPTTAYLNLVSAIEVLSGDFDLGEPTIHDLDPTLSRLVNCVEDEKLRLLLAERILKRERFIRRRFREFVLHYVDGTFYREQDNEHLRPILPSDLEGLLKRVYDQRSTTLHAGEPFPPYINRGPHRGEDLPLGSSHMSGGRSWDTEKKPIPLLHAFERLTRHVLLNYLNDKCGVPRDDWGQEVIS